MTTSDHIPDEDLPKAHRIADQFDALITARESDPFHLLGPHWIERDGEKILAIRSLRPDARELSLVWGRGAAETTYAAAKIDPAGLFEAMLPAAALKMSGDEAIAPIDYRLRFGFPDGAEYESYDAYAFPPILTEYDLYLSGEGTHYLNYKSWAHTSANMPASAGWNSRSGRRTPSA